MCEVVERELRKALWCEWLRIWVSASKRCDGRRVIGRGWLGLCSVEVDLTIAESASCERGEPWLCVCGREEGEGVGGGGGGGDGGGGDGGGGDMLVVFPVYSAPGL